ncbi:glycosyltransferase [Clostridium perfringens]|uniref:glycosyltransferase family 2 protein n=1 Tax=Clostridium perfringens TaxID=1502 RepID=UPI000F8DB372|nr:glycosyltransferase [Clostridium perfringens]RUR38696.1 glycosyltransferase [Clostridium perfringens]
MDQEIMVTICCVTYNQEKYISQAIESFLMQETNFKYEIIIHDDASTDNTTEIIRRYEEKFPDIIKPIYQVENQYSRGIIPSQIVYKKAKGKYITICEGDDYWTDCNKLQKQFDFLENNPSYIATAHWCEIVDKHGNISNDYTHKYKVFNFKNNIYNLEDYKNNIIPGHINTIMYRNIYLEHKYDYEKMYLATKLVGDRTTYLILSLLGKINVMNEFMSCYRYVVEDGGTNYVSIVKDMNQSYFWFNYYENLEKYSLEIMNKKISLKKLKYDSFIGGLFRYVKQPNNENKIILKKIFNKANKSELVLYFPIAFFRKIKDRVIFSFTK